MQAYAEGRWRDAATYYTHSRDELERLATRRRPRSPGRTWARSLISRGLSTRRNGAGGGTGHASRGRRGDRLDLRRDAARATRARPRRRRLRDRRPHARRRRSRPVGTAAFALEAWIYLAEAYARRGEGRASARVIERPSRRSGWSRRRSRRTSLVFAPSRYARRATRRRVGAARPRASRSRAASSSSTRRRRRSGARGSCPPSRVTTRGRARRSSRRNASTSASRAVLADLPAAVVRGVHEVHDVDVPARDDGLRCPRRCTTCSCPGGRRSSQGCRRLARIDQAVRHGLEIGVEERRDIVVEERRPAGPRGRPAR